MKRNYKINQLLQKGFLILWATAIFWFYLGNLVNFHQNRIWGKYLIPSCYTHSSVNKKDFGSLLNTDHDSFSSYLNIEFEGINQFPSLQAESPVLTVIYTITVTDDVSDYPLVTGTINLRGPPAA